MLDNPKGIQKRGSPYVGTNATKVVHLRVKQHRPGMKESNSWDCDYPTKVKCCNGGWDIYFTNDPSKVTCQKCKERHDSSQ